MPRRYFDKFPIINYNGFNVRDVTVSAKLINKYASFPYVYDPYVLDAEQRPDQVAYQIHDDQHMSWLIWYANKVVDPYYDWYLPEEEFNNFLKKKYGSVPYTHKKILFFRTNWYEDNREISPTEFNAMFGEYTAPHSYYWKPNLDPNNGRLISYTRREKDSVVNTNKIARIRTTSNSFKTGDLLEIRLNGLVKGSAEVARADSDLPTVNNILGEIGKDYTLNVLGNTASNCTITEFAASYNPSEEIWTRVNIPDEEYVYWSPVTVYDVENEKNESRKTIKVVDGTLAIRIADRLEDTLAGRV